MSRRTVGGLTAVASAAGIALLFLWHASVSPPTRPAVSVSLVYTSGVLGETEPCG